MTRGLRDARERAVGALAAAGARIVRVRCAPGAARAFPFLATLQAGAGQTIGACWRRREPRRRRWRTLIRRGSPHTVPTRLTLATELLPSRTRNSQRKLSAGRAPASPPS